MMASMGMMQPDPYYYMNAPVFARQPVSAPDVIYIIHH